MVRISEMYKKDEAADYNLKLKGIMKKRFTLAIDLDETLVYTQPYNQKIKEKVDVHTNNPDMVLVTHPT